jgi:UDP:flavonoid glycosyltransferase YjiC (YdhE family)
VNILLIALGSHGDVHPFVGIGLRLRERGHHVAVAANTYFKPLIDHANLEFVEVGTAEEYKSLATNPDLWHPTKAPQAVFSGTAKYLRRIYEVAVDFGRRPDSVIAASTLALGARVAQDAHDIPLATVHLSPSIFQSVYAPPAFLPFSRLPAWTPKFVYRGAWKAINKIMDRVIGPAINELRGEVHLPPVKNILRDYWHSPTRVIGLFPEWFGPMQIDWPRQTVLTGFPLFDEPEHTPISAELDQFLRAGEPPIAFTPGSAMWQGHAFFDACVESCVRLKRRGLLLTRHRDHLPAALPPGVIHVHYAPFSQLLPRCAALVHHGGIGTTSQALASGVPQLVTPFAHDQPDNAERLKRLGVAEWIAARKYKPARIVPALERLLGSPTVAESCRRAKARFERVDPLAQTCDLIEALRPARAAGTPVVAGTA